MVETPRLDVDARPCHRLRLVCAAAFVVLTLGAVGASAQPSTFVPGQVIVKFKPSASKSDALALQSSVSAAVVQRFATIDAELWEVSGLTVPDAIATLARDPRVAYAEPNYIVFADQVFPNDNHFGSQWNMHNTGQTGGAPDADVDAPEAWTFETGGDVLVGVIDTGVDWKHPDLAANIFTNTGEIPDNRLDDDNNGFVDDVRGWDFVSNDNDPFDDHGHGTHVAGTIAAIGNNEIGVAGVCWSARILPLKFLGAAGTGTIANAIRAIEYATMMGARVTNNSWGGTLYSQALYDAITEAGTHATLFIAAAGNSDVNIDQEPHYPAGYDLYHIITVANSDHADQRGATSNWGPLSVDLSAPGTNILSTFPDNRYATATGTSMAAPHVTGAVCLLWSASPILTNFEVKEAIMASVDPIPALQGQSVTGGRLNLFNLIAIVDEIAPAPVLDLAVESTGSNTAALVWTATGDDERERMAFRYDLRYSDAPIGEHNFDAATRVDGLPAPRESGTPESFTVTGLDFNTTYYFALVVEDEKGNRSSLSNVPNGTTLGIPRLEFTPGAFSASLHTGGSSVHVLTIRNTAEGTLDFAMVGAGVRALGSDPALPAWVRVTPAEGRVLAGQSLVVQIEFDATGLFGGDYDDDIVLLCNDPDQPSSLVDLMLHVTSAADIVAAPLRVDYGVRFTGTCVTDSVVIRNIGTEPLVVAGISTDNIEFTTDGRNFVLGLGERRLVTVMFCPDVVDVAPERPPRFSPRSRGTLTIATNDPDHPIVEVALDGKALDPPVVGVTPPSFAADLFTGASSKQVLTVSNLGGSDLDFEVSVDEGGNPALHVDVVGPSSNTDVPIRAVGRPLAPDELERLKASFPATVTIGPSEPGAVDKRTKGTRRAPTSMTLDRVGADLTEVFGSDANEYFGGPRTRGNLFTCTKGTTLLEHRFYLNPTTSTQMWFVVYEGEEQSGLYSLVSASDVSPSGEGLGWYSSGPIAVSLTAGKYYIIAAGFENAATYYNEQEIDDYPITTSFGKLTAAAGWTWLPNNQLPPPPFQFVSTGAFGDPVAYYQTLVTGSGIRWLALGAEQGTVPAQKSLDVAIRLDATGLPGGDYDANVRVTTNDPSTPVVAIPAHVHVTGAPDIAVSETGINFGAVNVGHAKADTVVIANTGSDILFVSSITSSDPQFTTTLSPFVLTPGTRKLVVVTFAPTSAGRFPAVLTIASIDPDESQVLVYLRGDGRESPTMVVTPSSFVTDLASGEVSTRALTITNSGPGELEFEISTIEKGSHPHAAPAVSIARSAGDFPRGAHAMSTGAAPVGRRAERTSTAHAPALKMPSGYAFATETQYFSAATLSLDAPESLRLFSIAPYWIWAGDFGVGDNSFAYALDEANRFVRIDTTTGLQSVLGTVAPVAPESWSGMALDPTDGTMYASASDTRHSSLYVIDVDVPRARRIGAMGFTGIVALAVDNDGRMYAEDVDTDQLILVNKATGAGTVIGSLGFDANFGQGMTFDPVSERLYIAAFNNYRFRSELRIADRTTGATTVVGPLGAAFPGDLVQLGWLAIPGAGGVPWMTLEPRRGVVAPGASLDVTVTLNASKLDGGDYDASLIVRGNDVATPEVDVPVAIRVTGIPHIVVSQARLNFGPVFVGGVAKKPLLVANTGTDVLTVSGISIEDDYTIDVSSGFTLRPDESRNLLVTFAPTTPGVHPASLTVTSNDPATGTFVVDLQGEGDEPPVIAVTPPSLDESLDPGGFVTRQITIDNSAGAADLVWDVGARFAGDAREVAAPPDQTNLETMLASLEIYQSHVTALVPNRWDFFDGKFGDNILDGGYDMYDAGNMLSTDLVGSFLEYFDSTIVSSPAFGFGGRYFTRKYPGLFVLAAEMNGVDAFEVSGGLGADGEGRVDGTVLHARMAGSDFYGFVKRVWDAGDPSVNHLIIVQDAPAAAHEFSKDTNLDEHRVFNLSGAHRLFHVVYSSWNGFYIDDSHAYDIMVTFLAALGLSPRWLAMAPASGTVPPGESATVDVLMDATDLAGAYRAHVVVSSNDPLRPQVVVPVSLMVDSTALASMDEPKSIPTRFELYANRPNPFNPTTTIAYDLPRDARVRLVIFDVHGREVRELVDAARPAGRHLAAWDGRNAQSEPVASGVYFYRLTAGDFVQTKKMVLLK